MSFFYLTAVKGDMPVHLLETVVAKRLDHLKCINKNETPVYNEFVMEGSVYDNVGHYMLCVIVILSENTSFLHYILKAECELFRRRLNALSGYELRLFAKKLLRSIVKTEYTPSFLEPIRVLCEHLKLKQMSQHVGSTTHNQCCSDHMMKLHFKFCLSFVAKRQVELRKGLAYLPCGKWKQYLVTIFKTNLCRRLTNTKLDTLTHDPRIMDILDKLKPQIPLSKNNYSHNVILSKNIDSVSSFFPPCMLNLHQNLRQKHRLTHTQRFYYSLFLKDIGMPVEEAIDFWRAEYRNMPNGSHSCCHNWEKDEKKYLYGIRHMYGLEGARKNYFSGSCHRIQNANSACHEGGCPFKCFDVQKMQSLLSKDDSPILSQINEFRKKNNFTNACILTLKKYSNEFSNCDNYSFTPVKYFNMAYETCSMKS